MRFHLITLLTALMASGSFASSGAAQSVGADGGPAEPRISGPEPRDHRQVFVRLLDMCSITGNANPCATVVQANNLSQTRSCTFVVRFYKGFETTPAGTAAARLVPPGQQATICSRDIGDPESCNVLPRPAPLTFDSGYATVDSNCDREDVAVQGLIVTKDSTDTTVTSRSLIRQVPINN